MAKQPVKDTNFNMRINSEKKASLENLFGRLGMTLPEAVNIFFENALLVGGIPFDVRLPEEPNETTYRAMAAADNNDVTGPFDSVSDLMESLNA